MSDPAEETKLFLDSIQRKARLKEKTYSDYQESCAEHLEFEKMFEREKWFCENQERIAEYIQGEREFNQKNLKSYIQLEKLKYAHRALATGKLNRPEVQKIFELTEEEVNGL